MTKVESQTHSKMTTSQKRRTKPTMLKAMAIAARLPGHDKRSVPGAASSLSSWRHKLNDLAHDNSVEMTLHILLIADIVLIVVALQLEMLFLESKVEDMHKALDDHTVSQFDDHEEHEEHYGNESIEHGVHVAVAMSVAILFIFLAHSLILMVANGQKWLSSPLVVLDFLVVILSISFELANSGENLAVGLLVLFRTWNFVRIGHGLYEIEHSEEDNQGEAV